MVMTVVRFTTAPSVKDMAGTVNAGCIATTKDGKDVRKVRIPRTSLIPQINQYEHKYTVWCGYTEIYKTIAANEIHVYGGFDRDCGPSYTTRRIIKSESQNETNPERKIA